MFILHAIFILVISLLIGGILLFRYTGKKHEVDYYSLFIMGLIFLPFGIMLAVSTDNLGLFGIAALGLIYLITGLKNKNKWKKPKKWNQLNKEEKKTKKIAIIGGIISLIIGVTVFLMILLKSTY